MRHAIIVRAGELFSYSSVSSIILRLNNVTVRAHSTATAKDIFKKLQVHSDDLRETSFAARVDNSRELEFENKTVLDAAARILSFQHPCTAVVLDGNSLKVSYNASKGLRFFKEKYQDPHHTKVLIERVESLVREVQQAPQSINGTQILLSLALKHSSPFNESYFPLVKLIKKLGQDKDNSDQIECSRALVALLNSIWSPSKLSFFDDKAKHDNYAKIKSSIERHSSGDTEFSSHFISINTDILAQYFFVLDSIAHNKKINEKLRKESLTHLLPPLNDAVKVAFFLKKAGVTQIDIVENDDALHCEVNILKKFYDYIIKNGHYVGISKLSCFLCEVALAAKEVPHAGTHGVFFYYDAAKSFFLTDQQLTDHLVKHMKTFITVHRSEQFKKFIANNPIEDFVGLTPEQIKDLSTVLKISGRVNQNADYCFGKDDHMEENITGFHITNPDRNLAYYTTDLVGADTSTSE